MADHPLTSPAARPGAPPVCPRCGTELAASLLCCPVCRSLVHAGTLKNLAEEADRATRANELPAALGAWREALDLLPPGSRQHALVSSRLAELGRKVESGPAGAAPQAPRETAPAAARFAGTQPATGDKRIAKGAAGLGALGILLWKLKFAVFFVLTKAKFLLLGLTKASTFFSMILSLGLYWAEWGWKFAVGIILSMYVHEMGHVAALRRYGIRATAPMFIPFLGAVVRLKQYPANPREDARVGLAGPASGMGAAVAVYAVSLATGWASWAAIARVGAFLNLFNLLPVWQLDGGRGFRSLSRGERWIAALAIGAMWLATKEGLLALLLVVAGARALGSPAPASDRAGLLHYVLLVAVLSAMCVIPVSMEALR